MDMEMELKLFEAKIFKFDPSDREILVHEGFRGLSAEEIKEMYLEGLKQNFFTLGFVLKYAEAVRREKIKALQEKAKKDTDVLFYKLYAFCNELGAEDRDKLRKNELVLQEYTLPDATKPFFNKDEVYVLKKILINKKDLATISFHQDERNKDLAFLCFLELEKQNKEVAMLFESNKRTLSDYFSE